MAYSKGKSKRSTKKCTSAKKKTSRGTVSKKLLDKYVETKVKKVLSSHGVARSVSVILMPARFDRSLAAPTVISLSKVEWPLHVEGPLASFKYALLPISELVPQQRPIGAVPDDWFRSDDVVVLKSVTLRMTLAHAEGLRLVCFAFRNPTRRGQESNSKTRPYVVQPVEGMNQPPSGVKYEVLSKEMLLGRGKTGAGALPRQLGDYDGPFAVTVGADGSLDWESTDGSAFEANFSSEEGRPVGKIEVSVDGGKARKCGRFCNLMMSSSSLMRTTNFDNGISTLGRGWTGFRFRRVKIYIELGKKLKFRKSTDSVLFNEEEYELFLGVDCPSVADVSGVPDVVGGCVTASRMKVSYCCVGT